MAFEDALKEPALLLKKQPKAMLPSILSLVPGILFIALIAVFLSTHAGLFNAGNAQKALANPSAAVEKIASLVGQVLLPIIAIILISWMIELLLSLVFVQISIQARQKRKEVSLNGAFSNSFKDLARLAGASLAAYFVVLVALAGAAIAAIALVMIASAVFGSAGNVAGIIIAFLFGLVGVIALIAGAVVFGFAFWIMPTVVVIENKGGFEAFKRSLELSRRTPLQFVALMLVAGVISLVVSKIASLIALIPFAGYALAQVMALPFNAWAFLLPPYFYFEYLQKKK